MPLVFLFYYLTKQLYKCIIQEKNRAEDDRMKKKKVAMEDIARALDISKNAVSLALRGKEGVGEDLRRRVIEKAREMHYETDKQSPRCILALISQQNVNLVEGMFYQQVCFYMESFARERGYLLTICSVSEAEEKACMPHPFLRQMPFQGVATIGNLSRDYCMRYLNCGLRYVMIDQYYDDIPVDSVTTANTAAAYTLTKHLIENGHTRIQYFGRKKRTSSLYDRWRGYVQAMNAHDLPVLHNSIIDADGESSADDYALVKKALDEMDDFPTAFVCGHDMTAKHIIDILTARGKRFPDDYSIVGFDDIQNPDVSPLNLTTYRTPKADIAKVSIDCLTDGSDRPLQKIELYGELIKRSSVRRIG